jgi:predicted RNA binding protein YcfA (HicA-like mRNA interferase family)
MRRDERTLERIERVDGGLHWKDVERFLLRLGAELHQGSGSTVTFVLSDRKLTVDRPHGRKECGRGLVRRVRSFLHQIRDPGPGEGESDD